MHEDSWFLRERRWLSALGLLLVACALLLAAREYVLRSMAGDWAEQQQAVQEAQSATIRGRLEGLCGELRSTAEALASESAAMDAEASPAALTGLLTHMRGQPYSCEWRDGSGTLRAYAGGPIRRNAPGQPVRPFAVINRTPYFLLVATVPDGRAGGGTMSVATPLAASIPASRRILHREAFIPALAGELDQDLLYSPDRPEPAGSVIVPFVAGNDTLGYVGFDTVTRENRVEHIRRQFDRILLLLLLAFLLTASVPLFRLYRSLPRAAGAGAMVLHVWAMRYALLLSGFAERLFPEALLDPAQYASAFGWGLSSSIGELTLSLLALLASVIAVHRQTARETARESASAHEGMSPPALRRRPDVSGLLSLLFVFSLLPFTLRAFAACLRSFVVDSSFNFDSIDGLFDEPMLLMMVGNSYLLSLALGFGLLAMYLPVKRALGTLPDTLHRLPWLLGGAVWSMLLLLFTTRTLLLPQAMYAGYLLLFISPVSFRVPQLRGRSGTLFAPLLVTAVIGSLLTVSLFGRWMERKRMSEIEAIAIDLARPVDGWSQVLMEQTLQYLSRADLPAALSASGITPASATPPASGAGTPARQDARSPVPLTEEDTRAEAAAEDLPEARPIDHAAAFQLWAGSPLSRLQNNSAILLLDSAELPRSRFAVGSDPFLLSMHTLSSTVARTEGIVQVIDRQMDTGERRYYQGYTDLPRRGRPPLVAVVILEALDPMDMAAQGIDLLRNAPAKLSSAPEDQFIVTRFRGSRILQTSDRAVERAVRLPESVRDALREEGQAVWDALPVDGTALQTYFMLLPDPAGEVLAITRGKSSPLLSVYRALRIAVLFAAFSAAIWFLAALFAGGLRQWTRLTFARRLQLALLAVAAIPLLLIWITGRDFALETALDEIERQVTEDLDVLRANILEQLPDSVPLPRLTGRISDQMCQEILLRTGRDLNVYRGTELLATSRPELYHVGVLNSRLHPDAWLNISLLGRDAWFTSERIGEFSYQVGYRALRAADGSLAAVISTPTLFQRERIDRGYTRASATIFIWIVAIALLVVLASAALARQISRPLNELLRATRDITAGNLDRRVHVSGAAEIVDLMDAFNTMTARLRRSQEELAAAERELAWKEMAKQVAHEIRNPLTPMKLAVQHLQRAWRDRASQIGDIIDTVTSTLIDQIDSLSHISDEFSRFARMPRRSTSHVDVGDVLRETVALFGSHEGVSFALRLPDRLPPVLADRDELARAFTNLFRNAVQATQEHGSITVTAESTDGGLRIRIQDSGSGIPEELLPRIFEPNFSTKTEGMGLGLAIVKKIIDDAGGTIAITSTPAQGTTVTITLPAG